MTQASNPEQDAKPAARELGQPEGTDPSAQGAGPNGKSSGRPEGGPNGLSTGLQPSGTMPGKSPGASVGSVGTGGSSSGVTGAVKKGQ